MKNRCCALPHESWPDGVLCIRSGPGANCSSVGSAVEMLFAGAVVGGMIMAVVSVLATKVAQTEQGRQSDERREGSTKPEHSGAD